MLRNITRPTDSQIAFLIDIIFSFACTVEILNFIIIPVLFANIVRGRG